VALKESEQAAHLVEIKRKMKKMMMMTMMMTMMMSLNPTVSQKVYLFPNLKFSK
jgi:hypothetical protein